MGTYPLEWKYVNTSLSQGDDSKGLFCGSPGFDPQPPQCPLSTTGSDPEIPEILPVPCGGIWAFAHPSLPAQLPDILHTRTHQASRKPCVLLMFFHTQCRAARAHTCYSSPTPAALPMDTPTPTHWGASAGPLAFSLHVKHHRIATPRRDGIRTHRAASRLELWKGTSLVSPPSGRKPGSLSSLMPRITIGSWVSKWEHRLGGAESVEPL